MSGISLHPGCFLALLLAPALATAEPSAVYRAGRVVLPDKATIAYYVRQGVPAGATTPPVVLIPGSWGDHRVFDNFVAALPAPIPVIVVELRGHGGSRPAAPRPSMDSLARDVLAVVDHLHLPRFFIGGHSIGGMLAIEIAGKRPEAVAGAIAMEGWTHHEVQREAFGSDAGATMTPDEERINQENRQRVLTSLTPAERAAFASVWRDWDGAPILASTPVPILELWGDRNHRERPSRAQLRLPPRPNIELEWIPGSGHSLLAQRPADAARATASFIARTQSAHMLEGPLPDLARLPKLASESDTIFRGEEGATGFNMHPYLAHFAGRFWAMWSTNKIRDLQAGQRVRYATSIDGRRWSPPRDVMPGEEQANIRYFARGFWIRGPGELWALAARDTAVRPLFAPDLELRGYQWNTRAAEWASPPVVIARDAINNFPPERLPGSTGASGEWMMSRRDHTMRVSMLTGGGAAGWSAVPMPEPADGAKLDEPTWWPLPDGILAAAMRDGSRSRRLYRSLSFDNGRAWSPPVRTNFPDAMAKFNVLRLRRGGIYLMASNPNPTGKRIPLCLSASRDGLVFHRMAILQDADTVYRYAGKDPGYAGYHYPQLLEHGGSLYVIYSENMEDIRLLRLRLDDVERWAR